MKKMLHFLVLCLLATYVQAQTPGVSTYYQQTSGDTRNYIEYIPGNLPIIISAPHGGILQSGQTIGGVFYPDNDSSLPDRSCGTNERDDNTDILVREIQKEIFQLTGCYAHVIINNLHRSKLDPNREINEATCGNANAADHWNAFHNFIDQASASVEANWGKGLYIDLHGQSHSIPRIEAGYNITANELNIGDLNAANIINKSTIRNLVNNNLNNLSHEELIRGNNSLGEMFQDAAGTFYASLGHPGCGSASGYRAIPSATNNGGTSCDDTRPYTNAYFDGDYYNNRRHGSGNGTSGGVGGAGTIDGIMTEVNRRVRDLGTYNGQVYDSRPQTLVPFAKDYAAVVLNFINTHYNDFANFGYLASMYAVNGPNPSPIVTGVANGIFSAPAGLAINPSTGEIDTANSTPGDYVVTYSAGTCGYFSSSQTISIVTDISQDTEPPTAPSGLSAFNTTETTTDLMWTTSTDNVDIVGYNIYQNGTLRETIPQVTNYVVENLTPNTSYAFKLTALDSAGNESAESNEVTITTLDNVTLNYCTSQSSNVTEEYISNVQFGDINNASGAQVYSDFTNISTELVKNGQYMLTVTPTWPGTPFGEAYAAWIDYNQDGDFTDAGEQVWTQASTTASPVSTVITIPTSAPNGTTRMRISMKYNVLPTACETFNYGEVEDYTVTIVSATQDTVAPIITLLGDNPVQLFVNDTYTDAGATAIDNVDGDITDIIEVTGTVDTAVAGTYTIFYNVRDAAGNVAVEVTRTVNIVVPLDETPPSITLNGADILNLNIGDSYTELGATATDNIDGDISANISITGTVDTAVAGTYTIRYNVNDAAGNAAAEVTRTVIVEEITIGCVNGIETFPYSESFENSLGAWAQSTEDAIDWTLRSGTTPSNGTGPASASDGSFYLYVEASGNGTGYPNKQAILTSPCINLSQLTEATFSFDYHMFGTDLGTLDVEISEDEGVTWTSIWSRAGNQGDAWQSASIDISAYAGSTVQVRFNRVTGSTWRADVAIDNISILDEVIAIEGCANGITNFPYTESYENTLGAWTQSSQDDIDWTVDANGTPSGSTGPSSAVSGSYYIYVEASGNGTGYPNKQAIINSPCYDLTSEANASFSFSYHMYGANDMGTISLDISNDNATSWTTIWSETGNKGNQWNAVAVDVSEYVGQSVQFRFNRVTGGTWQADVAIDNIALNTTLAARQETSNTKETNEEATTVSLAENNLTIFPNPVKETMLHIRLDNGTPKTFAIKNVYGQTVASGKADEQIRVNQLASGIYILEVSDGHNTFTKKFIKQ
ncbi:putative secreted protein (Por secretion system target) [Kordia periserrulae]|uniref:Putative secreted protein (Por secretion system target) n=1 Tax=Kordia periserrulae TaxID=701523 RepID=A0A2T6BUH4_9FLAO|nr:immunoglobulin-like domain-containing protein [Kordia periserrulae]PTX59712.1 putative secreted protein (Por secretion system target) [Kordia periserrulae]